jgi:hypothetical protein
MCVRVRGAGGRGRALAGGPPPVFPCSAGHGCPWVPELAFGRSRFCVRPRPRRTTSPPACLGSRRRPPPPWASRSFCVLSERPGARGRGAGAGIRTAGGRGHRTADVGAPWGARVSLQVGAGRRAHLPRRAPSSGACRPLPSLRLPLSERVVGVGAVENVTSIAPAILGGYGHGYVFYLSISLSTSTLESTVTL